MGRGFSGVKYTGDFLSPVNPSYHIVPLRPALWVTLTPSSAIATEPVHRSLPHLGLLLLVSDPRAVSGHWGREVDIASWETHDLARKWKESSCLSNEVYNSLIGASEGATSCES
jgi:hypothetical protein